MKYISTRGNYKKVDAAEAIRTGMVPSGGLFVPETIPEFKQKEISKLVHERYQEIAVTVLQKYLSDYNRDELEEAVTAAYNKENFPVDEVVPLAKLDDKTYLLELWHGPTAAFKDMALQLMPQLLTRAVRKIALDREIVILVATSGDTGKAALEGFKNLSGIKIIVFYPAEGVSKIQERQMLTTTGDNTYVVAVNGNFDDCQATVKSVFADQEFNMFLNQKSYQFSSANSINWGRLLPQIVYYFSAYANLMRNGAVKREEKFNIVVPTGNFGNILAAFYAYKMGLPVNKFVCASNENKVLTDFFNTGIYNIKREFKKTISPSMDILISSNLERFLFEMNGRDAEKINKWYEELKVNGSFEIDSETHNKIKALFIGDYALEAEVCQEISNVYTDYNYLLDPHTAVAVNVYGKYYKKTATDTKTIIASTANPYKFSESVLKSIDSNENNCNEYEEIRRINQITGLEIHRAVKDLEKKELRHTKRCEPDRIKEEILDILKI